ncbi:uncharacterized, partial [Tachysurus ichikawai]
MHYNINAASLVNGQANKTWRWALPSSLAATEGIL